MNIVVLSGRFVKDPELKYTPQGTAVCEFTLAVDTGFGDNKKINWPNCVAWGRTAEFISESGAKGKEVTVKGELTTGSYENNDGKKVYWTKVNVQEFKMSAVRGASGDEDDQEERPVKDKGKPKKKESAGGFDDDEDD